MCSLAQENEALGKLSKLSSKKPHTITLTITQDVK